MRKVIIAATLLWLITASVSAQKFITRSTHDVPQSTAAESNIQLREEPLPPGDVTVKEDTTGSAPSELNILPEVRQQALVSESCQTRIK